MEDIFLHTFLHVSCYFLGVIRDHVELAHTYSIFVDEFKAMFDYHEVILEVLSYCGGVMVIWGFPTIGVPQIIQVIRPF
jgi:hypothetical protein